MKVSMPMPWAPRTAAMVDRAKRFMLGTGLSNLMRAAGHDMAHEERKVIDTRALAPLSQSRREQRARHEPPRGRVVHGIDHPLKATGQLYDSITGGVLREPGALASAIVSAKNQRRLPESMPMSNEIGVRLANGRVVMLTDKERRKRARAAQKKAAKEARRIRGGLEMRDPMARFAGLKSQAITNANLVRWHRAKGRDVSFGGGRRLPRQFIERWKARLRAGLKSAIKGRR